MGSGTEVGNYAYDEFIRYGRPERVRYLLRILADTLGSHRADCLTDAFPRALRFRADAQGTRDGAIFARMPERQGRVFTRLRRQGRAGEVVTFLLLDGRELLQRTRRALRRRHLRSRSPETPERNVAGRRRRWFRSCSGDGDAQKDRSNSVSVHDRPPNVRR